ncbi:MAG: FtsW/RodA/SpoVE family cell cycle protein, partial [Thermoguttaceae bacterium]|nr:FtsW/RodA/SpoVE family cell cycle protein [Thermoguttaceae bacterium]
MGAIKERPVSNTYHARRNIVGFFVPELIFRFDFLKKYTWIYAGVGIVAIGIVLILGATINGSKISFSVSGISFQPSEVVKI